MVENGEGVTVAPYCSLGECQLRVTARGRDEAEALRQVEPVVDAICGVLGDCVYDVTETSDGSMQEAAGRALVARHLTVSTAESCTGGMVAASLVDYPGISECLYEAHGDLRQRGEGEILRREAGNAGGLWRGQ